MKKLFALLIMLLMIGSVSGVDGTNHELTDQLTAKEAEHLKYKYYGRFINHKRSKPMGFFSFK